MACRFYSGTIQFVAGRPDTVGPISGVAAQKRINRRALSRCFRDYVIVYKRNNREGFEVSRFSTTYAGRLLSRCLNRMGVTVLLGAGAFATAHAQDVPRPVISPPSTLQGSPLPGIVQPTLPNLAPSLPRRMATMQSSSRQAGTREERCWATTSD